MLGRPQQDSVDLKASVAIVTGKVKRRGPALPGLTKRILPRSSIAGLCECPETTAVKARGGRVEIELARL
jgi:hypothetical protein